LLTLSVSGQPAQEPVVTKNGDIYEKRLIVKHIESHGVDPITNEALGLDELVSLRVSNSNGVKPRQISQSSIPGLLPVGLRNKPNRVHTYHPRPFKTNGMR
jgi:pre-mRNA-processing factor 19